MPQARVGGGRQLDRLLRRGRQPVQQHGPQPAALGAVVVAGGAGVGEDQLPQQRLHGQHGRGVQPEGVALLVLAEAPAGQFAEGGTRDRTVEDAFTQEAAARPLPLTVIHLTDPDARAVYGTTYVLVRPDQHVAWRGSVLPDGGARAVLDRVLGVDAVRLDADDPAGSLTRFGAQVGEAVAGTAGPDGVAVPGGPGGRRHRGGRGGGTPGERGERGRRRRRPRRAPGAYRHLRRPGRRARRPYVLSRPPPTAHRSTLSGGSGFRRGALDEPVPEALLTAAYESEAEVPALILTGDADPLADRDALTRTAKSLPRARLSIVRDAHHDVLNDMQHRTVAAEIVTFLEALRNELVPLVTVESTAW
ncbi:hypothetical protein ACFYX8_28970 [Streptomyces cyaneofuscatus]|uniref:aromatic-ring hydroxylase C-terminal domain-containing protein n=1 Tax=Streptomyces cyaneofuscatus TaxID=66883 RepID=UPI0036B4E6DD